MVTAQTRTALSHPGLIVGTLGYVSPEQIRGEEIDARADLFSLGVVLHEMTTGERTFNRQSTIETLNAILKEDPPEPPAAIPAGLRHIIAHCLEKDPARRFQSAQDVAFALRSFATASTTQSIPADVRQSGNTMRRVGRIAAVIALLGAGALLSRYTATTPVDLSRVGFVPFAVDAEYEEHGAWSPDGKSLAYVRRTTDGGAQIVLRAEDSSSISVLARERAQNIADLFWSADGSRVF